MIRTFDFSIRGRRMGAANVLLTILLCLIMLSAGQSAEARRRKVKPRRDAATATTRRSPLSYEQQRRFDTFFLQSTIEKEKGNYDAAFDLLRHCLDIDPDAPEALSQTGMILSVLSPEDTTGRAAGMIRRAADLAPDNYYYQSQLADYYDNAGLADSALARYELMSQRFPDKVDLLYRLSDIYRQRNDYRNVIRTFDRLEVKEGRDRVFTYNKAIAYFHLGDTTRALFLADSLRRTDTADVSTINFRASLLYDMGHKQEALRQYQEVLASDPTNEQANMALLTHYLSVNDTAAYLRRVGSIVTDPGFPSQMRLKMFNSLVVYCAKGVVDSTAALPLFRRAAALPDADASLLDMYQAYMQMLHMPEDSIVPVWSRLLSLRPDYTQVRLKVLQYAIKQNDNPLIAKLCREGAQQEPDNLAYYFYGAIALYSQDKTREAETVIRKGAARINDKTDASLASDIYSILGEICHKLGKTADCYQAYDSALVYKDDNISVLNNYAYFLSLEKRQLDKAERMSATTIKAESENATYLDTYAWVLFQRGRYKEAAEYITKALSHTKEDKENASVYEHAGDISYVNGRKADAMRYWRKAKALGGGSKTLARKIRLGKYIAE